MVCLIIVSTPGPHIVKVRARFGQFGDEYGQGFIKRRNLQVSSFEKFTGGVVVVVGWWGGLFDYSVYSWPSFNQEWNQPMVGPCQDQVRTRQGPRPGPGA